MPKLYSVSAEIEGQMAFFARPDTGASFVTYPAPTRSAVKGMFECVARLKSAFIRPTHVHICRPLQFHSYATNYNGPLRKSNQIKKDSPYQLKTVVLVDVCYQIFGVAVPMERHPDFNHLHYLQDKFQRRLRQGRLFQTPCLGWKEFTPSYFGPIRTETKPCRDVNETIPAMLLDVFDKPVDGVFEPRFVEATIKEGVLHYAQ